MNAAAPYAPMPIRVPKVSCTDRTDGSSIIVSDYTLPPLHRSLYHLFLDRAQEAPGGDFIARRRPLPDGGRGDWQAVTYGDAERLTRGIAQGLLDLGCSPDNSVMVLSGPSIEHALFMLGAHAARIPYAPVSTGFSLLSRDFAKLRHAFDTCRPGLLFVDDGQLYEKALQALPLDGVRLVTVKPPEKLEAISFAEFATLTPTGAVDESVDAITLDDHVRTLFTSGSTGMPKAVIHTNRMLMAHLAQQEGMFPEDEGYSSGPILSWLPWSHLGGNANIAFAINSGGTLYIDEGRPVPGECDESIRNLREIAVRDFFSAPVMFGFLVEAMESDAVFRNFFFSRLRLIVYGTASIAQNILDRLQALAVATTGRRIPITSKYGATEAMGITQVPRPFVAPEQIGVPNPGVTLKLVPVDGQREIRVKGPCVMPGYLNNPEATAQAFDGEGFYCTGDAGRLLDPGDPSQGLVFDGRLAENFKLSSGSWVPVGQLRSALIDTLEIVSDCVVAGQGRDDVRVIAWLDPAKAAAVAGMSTNAPMADLISSPPVLDFLAHRLGAFNRDAGGGTRRVRRILLLEEPPTEEEVTEKRTINQRATLHHRQAIVDALYASDSPTVAAAPAS